MAKEAFIDQLSRMYRNSSGVEFALPEDAEEFDLDDVACPACPVALGSILTRQDDDMSYTVSLYFLWNGRALISQVQSAQPDQSQVLSSSHRLREFDSCHILIVRDE